MMQTTADELVTQLNKMLRRKWANPAHLTNDSLSGLVVHHDGWNYRASSYIEAFNVAVKWSEHSRPAWMPEPKITLLTAATEFIKRINLARKAGATREEINAALNFLNTAT